MKNSLYEINSFNTRDNYQFRKLSAFRYYRAYYILDEELEMIIEFLITKTKNPRNQNI